MKIKAIIFDVDGTLVNSLDFIVDTFVETAKEAGFQIKSEDVRKLIGIPGREIIKRVLKISDPQKIEEIRRRWNEIQRETYAKRVKLYPGVKETLEYLKKRGFKLAVATSLLSEKAKEVLQTFNIKKYFDTCVAADDVKRGKPSPDVFLEAARRLKVEPEECIIIGDTEYDIMAAKAAKIKIILFDPKKQRLKSVKTKPDYIIHSYQELKKILHQT